MRKNSIALVVHRYGKGINGGAEDHCRALSEHLRDVYDVEILTSCSRGIGPWDNGYKSGRETIDGINVIRFVVEDSQGYPEDSAERRGPFCPQFKNYMIENHKKYKAVIYITYSHYLSYIGLMQNFDNAIFIPTAHNESWLRKHFYKKVFKNVKGFLFNSIEERLLIEEMFEILDTPARTTCYGLDVSDYDLYCNENKKERYIIYAGRVSDGKNFQELNEYFLRYKMRNKSDLKLIVIGKMDNYMTVIHHDDIIFKGFVPEEEKKRLIANAMLLALPSKMESLSIVLLESFACKCPVLVNGDCAVLRGQCKRSNGGFYYADYSEFEEELNYLLNNDDIRKKMGENGYKFVKQNYSWNRTVENVISLINEISNGDTRIDNTKQNIAETESLISISSIIESIKVSNYKEKALPPKEKYMNRLVRTLLGYDQVVIVGAGVYGEEFFGLLVSKGYDSKVVCFADNNSVKYQDCDKGRTVNPVEEAVRLYAQAYFVITPKYYMMELITQLLDLNISLDQIGYYL